MYKRKVAISCLGLLLLGIAFYAVIAAIFTWAWNIVVPSLFGGPHIDYLQSFGLFILVSIVGSAFQSVTSHHA